MAKTELTWEELKPLLMWIKMPCCQSNRGVMKDSKFPRALACKKCGAVWFVTETETGYSFQKAV